MLLFFIGLSVITCFGAAIYALVNLIIHFEKLKNH
jgi:hypothetical protein